MAIGAIWGEIWDEGIWDAIWSQVGVEPVVVGSVERVILSFGQDQTFLTLEQERSPMSTGQDTSYLR